MSGRDLRTFVNFHRDAIGASDPSLVSRLVDGKNSSRYREINYDKIKAITQIKSAAGLQSLQKIKSIHQHSKEKKEFNILQQHKTCWKKELIQLNSLYKTKVNELEMVQSGLPWEQSLVKDFFDEVKDYQDFIKEDFLTFSKNTVKPVWDLQEDIHIWLQENKNKLATGEADPSQVSYILESVKFQQRSIMRQLEEEQNQLENDLEEMNVQQLTESSGHSQFKSGIPEEASVLSCPYNDLKSLVLNEFQLLDQRYESHLDYLKVKYQPVLGDKEGGWSKDDHLRFQYILEQYTPNVPNRRSLYIDRMLREMPHKSRRMIVEHEEWWFSLNSFQNQEQAMRLAWEKDRGDLLLKVKATFIDAWSEYDSEKKREESRKKQHEICEKLHKRVEAFQQQKRDTFQLQLEISEKSRIQEIERMKAEEEKEKKRRDVIRAKVKQYQEKKISDAEAKLEKEKRRLAEMQKQMDEQAKKDAERVTYRENELKKRQETKRLLHQKHLEEQEEMERRLDRLREQVCVNVTTDPYRVFKSTEASRARVAKPEDEELELQQPLFTINTFNTQQITADPRLKVEQALRRAGLHNSDYARQILASVKPLHAPRPEQQSSLFKK